MNKAIIKRYILDNKGRPILENDFKAWSRWLGINSIIQFESKIKNVFVTTIFLAMDYSFGESITPVLWETLAATSETIIYSQRCAGSKEQAEAMHEDILDAASRGNY